MIAEVRLWGRRIGAVLQPDGDDCAAFEYDTDFVRSRIEVAPLVMPLADRIYRFPELARGTFHGLPGLLADSLPDRFGNALIDAWLATQGRTRESFGAVERLCYTGSRGMGALEFLPRLGPGPARAKRVQIDALVRLAGEVLASRAAVSGSFAKGERERALQEILRVGTSAGGARPKAVIEWNPVTNEVRSGQVASGSGFEPWLLKFDGVQDQASQDLSATHGFGAIEYAYSEMAKAAGITMTDCRLFEENGRRHFLTRRFDRGPRGEKLHMQSLGALAHLDFNLAGAHSYEQAFQCLRRLGLPNSASEELFRRMAFNLVARNQDDHVKNIAFLMDRSGEWSLAPAFDLTYSFNPAGLWTNTHQMTVNGKRDDFLLEDLEACASSALLKRGRAKSILLEVQSAVSRWPTFASAAAVAPTLISTIHSHHRLRLA